MDDIYIEISRRNFIARAASKIITESSDVRSGLSVKDRVYDYAIDIATKLADKLESRALAPWKEIDKC